MSKANESKMYREALQAPTAVERLLRENRGEAESLAGYLRRNPPPFALTVARGSSDHAALYGKYLVESLLGVVVSSAIPSVTTVYGASLSLNKALLIAVSQSGESPDLLEVTRQARRAGALTVAFVNKEASPLAQMAEVVFPLWAAEEEAVAATKSYLATLAALTQLVAYWADDRGLKDALAMLPEAMYKAAEADWSAGLEPLAECDNALVVGRGYAFAVANELALKLKETGALHAEAMSGAELLHGPVALVEPGFPLLVLVPRDRPMPSMVALLENLRPKGGHLLVASSESEALELAHTPLPLPTRLHPVLDSILIAQAFYPFAAHLSFARGFNPDAPRNLSKVTRTR
ncbi:SIS domain-containing protein [Calidithermus roseus]|uniref:Glutamine--fructose-6-phosphate aminotransferase [isomerizing] n=1 Tax=Calidithermus roseus TaxID=1644118 RepID=A0A399EN83_9DEIN|nr:SIS domain-containing protein [Calidithermus roseus]RIH83611.1 Glutamine--fructose-6-phosphate aminotransferase [isomerizing] [Calidithermus roseus]